MARINVEDGFWFDPRLKALAKLVGCEDKATGMCIRAWRMAQEHWKDGDGLIPCDLWDISGLDQLISCKLARLDGKGVYVSGASKHLTWLCERQEAAKTGGQASAAARKSKYGTAIPNNARNRRNTEATPKQTFDATEAKPNPLTLTLALTLPEEEIRDPPPEGMSEPAGSRPSPRTLAELWNEKSDPTQAKLNLNLLKPTSKRWTWARCRLREHPEIDYWRSVVERIAKSSFCRGQNDRGWRADFDFLVRAETHLKVGEGKYDDIKEGNGIDWSKFQWETQ